MSKSKKQNEVESSNEEQNELTEFNNAAIGLVKHNGVFKTIKVPYNVELGLAGVPEVLGEDVEKTVAVERFKMSVIKEGLFN
jgi:hypothetical protein